MDDLKHIIESLVFVSETPLSINRLKAILEDVDVRDIRLALTELQAEYEARNGGFTLQEVAGGYQFRTRAEYSEWIKKLLKPSPTRLSRAALETLAIIAYKQPIIRADVEHIRGVDSGGVLRMLLERKFIRVLGRKDIPGRPMIYGTTREFLEIFNLKDLSELPSPKEITSLGAAEQDEDAPSGGVAADMVAGEESRPESDPAPAQAPDPDGTPTKTARLDETHADAAGGDAARPQARGGKDSTSAVGQGPNVSQVETGNDIQSSDGGPQLDDETS
jgi:segregation and condensation protein B